METAERKPSRNRHMPLLAKITILVQAAVILSFTVGMYQEYLNNSYLQAYVVNLFTSNLLADTMLSMVTVSVFAIGTFTLLGSMRTTKKLGREWENLAEPATVAVNVGTVPVLARTEQALKSPRMSQRRRRKPRVNTEELYRSMVNYSAGQSE